MPVVARRARRRRFARLRDYRGAGGRSRGTSVRPGAREDPSRRWPRVLDYGCGSGILAIGASLHGAGSVDAVDIDPLAVDSARANARANDVRIDVGLPDAAAGVYSLVMANILATPLKLLAPLLCGHLDNAADLILSGLLERQAAEIASIYEPWIALEIADVEDGWVLMAGSMQVPRMASSTR